MTKKCKECKELKNITEFYKHKIYKDGLDVICKKCVCERNKNKYGQRIKKYNKFYKEKNKKTISDYNKNWKKKNKGYTTRWTRDNKYKYYGISPEEYNFVKKDICEICGKNRDKKKTLCLDHCHKTLKIRGFLCSTCNRGLSFFGDDIILLKEAVKYLKREPYNISLSGKRWKKKE